MVQDRDIVAVEDEYVWPFEWHHCQWPLVTLKVTFAVWKLSVSNTSGNATCIMYVMFAHES